MAKIEESLQKIQDIFDGSFFTEHNVVPKKVEVDWFLDWFLGFMEIDDPPTPLPYLYPTAEGEISMEWQIGDNIEIVAEIDIQQKKAHCQIIEYKNPHLDVDIVCDVSAPEGTLDFINKLHDLYEEAFFREVVNRLNNRPMEDYDGIGPSSE